MPVDSYDCSVLRMLFGGKWRQTFIGFDGFAILEQHLVSAAQFRFAHKYDDACGKSVQTVRGNNIRFAILFPKSNQRGFAIPHAARCGGEKMRFVNHDNRIVLVKNSHSNGMRGSQERNDASSADAVGASYERLLHGDGLGEITRLVNVIILQLGHVHGEQLQRHHVHQRLISVGQAGRQNTTSA